MPLDLDRLQQRIVGVLVEKEMTVPESYPLTLNALVAGCNQKSNRDPQMEVELYEVEGALHALMDAGWVVQMERSGGRTVRFEHQAREQLMVKDAELAILTELLNRGPQSPSELKTRAGRMHPFASPQEVETLLSELASRPVPYVEQLARRPREHAARWMHCLGDRVSPAPAETDGPAAVPAPTPTTPPAPAPAHAAPGLAARVEALEAEVARLRERLAGLEGEGRSAGANVP